MNVGAAITEIRKHGLNRQWWRKRFLARVISQYFTRIGRPDVTPLVERDWDNLLLLDACRYDLFEEVPASYSLPGALSKRRSVESGTPGYLAENFGDGTYHDLVYVTANPYVNTELDVEQFHAVVPVWRDGWDDDVQTVPPETMGERAHEVAEQYPEKRLLVHFNQPHAPFIGEKRLGGRKASAIRQRAMGQEQIAPSERRPTPFDRLAAGESSREEVWSAYRSNLERVLPVVDGLLRHLEGRTVVTSDHGNALGEFAWPFPIRVYGHPLGILIPALTEVPWHVHDNGERRPISAEPPASQMETENEQVDERLRMLGYAE